MDENFKVTVDNSFEYNFKHSETKKLDILKLSESKFHVIHNNKSFNVELEKSNFFNKEYVINVNSNNYTVKISNQLDLLIKEMGFTIGTSKKSNDIKSPMPGLILNINVEIGQKVSEGETLLILEAMKMENTISSPKSGIIKSIYIKKGETVEKGELMIELE
ncbi:acetyl-CoA carboxylase biotin carboxyl carrier protein subunit [Lutibacter profundi]|uniref:Acetyl-CoA carboxylase biotin carboxyl carrier protein subunit n=1 Tax=Lutibacter profundi TaxID=1622118 RepID=A0A0X8G8C0_9FLAO|nr:acetyl-CoA carboxylase biotin carboxyl carrier protein subunit [Lutibacter profundi]AMC11900.1 acetyl-CoA carboxylase biotin carboxyl carrier protein subunit [Lutibacter profundi]